MKYKERIKENILNKGNSYGEDLELIEDNTKLDTILFRGCTSRFREEELIESVSKTLKYKNIKFHILKDETCCGIMLFLLDLKKEGEEVVKRNIEKFKKHNIKRIITICPGCFESLKDHYSKYEDFNIEIVFAMDLIDEELNGEGYIIHDPCHALERREQVRSIIKNVPKERANSCCGFGVSVKSGKKELKEEFAKKTLSKSKVITYCPACYHTLNTVNSKKTIDFFTFFNNKMRG